MKFIIQVYFDNFQGDDYIKYWEAALAWNILVGAAAMLRAVRVIGEVGSDGFEGGRAFLQTDLGRRCEACTEGFP